LCVAPFNDARVNDANLKPARAEVKVVVHGDWPTGTMESPSLVAMKWGMVDRGENVYGMAELWYSL
jgi:hypothetical protein